MSNENLVRVLGDNTVYGAKTGAAYRVDTIAELKAVSTRLMADGQIVVVLGYYSDTDGAGGQFQYSIESAAADNGGTIIAPTGGVGRWLRIAQGFISPKWFGAKGIGSTHDDTSAMQGAMNAAAGGTLWIEPCSSFYAISDYINGVSNVEVVGTPGGQIRNIDPDTDDDVSIFLFAGKSNFSVKDCYLVGSNKNINVVPMHGSGVACNGCTDFIVENNRFEKFTRSGVAMENCTSGKVLHNHVSLGNANLTTYDIETYTETGETNFDILIDGNTCTGSNTFGISITNHGDGETKFTRVINNQISAKARHGIFCYAGDTFTPVDIIIRGNTVEDVGWIGIYVVGGGLKYVIEGNILIDTCNNVAAGLPWAAIGIGGVTGTALVINANVIQGTNGYPGVRIDNGNSFSISANIIWGDGTVVAGGEFGTAAISLNDCAEGSVTGNVIKYTGVEGAGIALISTTTTVWNRVSLDDNKIYHPSTFGINTTYSGLGSIEGNVIEAAVLFGIYLDHSTGTSISGNTINGSSAGSTDIFISATCTLCAVEMNKVSGTKATGSGIVIETACTDTIVQDNDLVGLTILANTAKLTNNGTRTQLKNNKYAAVPMNGSFTCTANTNSTVANANIVAASKVTITPTNAAAAALMAGVKSLFLNGLTSGTSFTFTTADGSAAAGTETFNYIIE